MYDKRAEQAAVRCGIMPRLQALENGLLQIDGISEISFDLQCYAEHQQIILVPRYFVALDRRYFEERSRQLNKVLDVCEKHDLHATGDSIENQGEHWYIVRKCGATWPRYKTDGITRRWLEEHAEELTHPSAMKPALLATACTYTRGVNNPFAWELVRRAGSVREFSWAVNDAEKMKVLRACAASLHITFL